MTNKEITKRNVRRVKNLLEEVKELTPEKFQTILDRAWQSFTTIASTIRLFCALQAAPR